MLMGPRKPEKLAVRTIEGQRVVPSWMREPQTTCTGRHRREILIKKLNPSISDQYFMLWHIILNKNLYVTGELRMNILQEFLSWWLYRPQEIWTKFIRNYIKGTPNISLPLSDLHFPICVSLSLTHWASYHTFYIEPLARPDSHAHTHTHTNACYDAKQASKLCKAG